MGGEESWATSLCSSGIDIENYVEGGSEPKSMMDQLHVADMPKMGRVLDDFAYCRRWTTDAG